MQKQKSQLVKSFTLVELLLVIGIIALLFSIITVALGNSQAKSRDAKRENDLRQIMTAVEFYNSEYGKLPKHSSGDCGNNDVIAKNGKICSGFAFKTSDKTYIHNLPKDPLNQDYKYSVSSGIYFIITQTEKPVQTLTCSRNSCWKQ